MGAKESLSNWWILIVIALFLWYRGNGIDRVLAIFFFVVGIIQLIEYSVYSHCDYRQAGSAIYITLWLQCLVLAICVFTFIRSRNLNSDNPRKLLQTLSGILILIFSVVVIIALIQVFLQDNNFSAHPVNGHIEWTNNGGRMLGSFTWLYLIGIFLPIILLFAYYSWADLGIALLILYGALSAVYVISQYPIFAFGSMWAYLSIGLAFIAWIVGGNVLC